MSSPMDKRESSSRSRSRSRSPAPRSRSGSGSPAGRRSRSPVRSRSKSNSPAKKSRSPRSKSPAKRDDVDEMLMSSDDVAFVLGRGGSTKHKISRVSNCRLDLDDKGRMELKGTEEQRAKAKEYVKLVLDQRVGPVYIDFDEKRDDLTPVDVPSDCVGYVTGRQGVVLRSLEEEWGTLMFFAKPKGSEGEDDKDNPVSEKLAIFGPMESRCGAELKVMSAVEHKHEGFFMEDGKPNNGILERYDDGDFGVETMPLAPDEVSYALGRQGSTRKKLAFAANCILEYIANVAFIAGTKAERQRGKDYLEFLMMQRSGKVEVDTKDRDDVTVIEVPSSVMGYLTGARGASLREIEAQTGTFCFGDGDRNSDRDGTERLYVFSGREQNRRNAERIIHDRMRRKVEDDKRGYGRGGYQPRERNYDDRRRDYRDDRRDRRYDDRRYDDRRHDDRRDYDDRRGRSDDRRGRYDDRRRSRSPRRDHRR